jgi:hypothetical protein
MKELKGMKAYPTVITPAFMSTVGFELLGTSPTLDGRPWPTNVYKSTRTGMRIAFMDVPDTSIITTEVTFGE